MHYGNVGILKRDENRTNRPSNECATGSEHINDRLHVQFDQDELLHNSRQLTNIFERYFVTAAASSSYFSFFGDICTFRCYAARNTC